MISQQTLRGNWNEIKGMLRSKWGALTEDDLAAFNGNLEQLVGTIQRKTGEAREGIEQFFEQLASGGAEAFHRAADAVQKTSHQAAAAVREGYDDVEEIVRQRPGESLAVCFGAGVITGIIVSLLLRWR